MRVVALGVVVGLLGCGDVEVASDAPQVYGGSGSSREYPVAKRMRDARASTIEDCCNEVSGLIAAPKL